MLKNRVKDINWKIQGWHNNHYVHRHRLVWYEIDINWWGIRVMQFWGLGLAGAIKLVSLAQRFLA